MICLCDGLAGTRPHTLPACAIAASVAPEHKGLSTNESSTSWMTQEGGTLKRSAAMESGEKERKKELGGAADDGEEEREDGAGGQQTGTPIGGSWIQDRSIPATGGIRTRKGKEETGMPRRLFDLDWSHLKKNRNKQQKLLLSLCELDFMSNKNRKADAYILQTNTNHIRQCLAIPVLTTVKLKSNGTHE
ncbi:hypothetical protein NDU88_002231 [Pleurodeles waltl]|uniref:Uncharacterized protein n=1 Tax=Pleurodeles waltl TaxID=8319 RepID=A0AAV7MR11_PLEWA|nr:hypothetical protein NDU88_002231 [Pleurodeles waltl]